MAGPLHYFRKNQGYILAVLGVILIVTWVIGPSIVSLFEPSSAGSSNRDDARTTVATWKNGKITRSDLDRWGWEHEALLRFLGEVVRRAQEDGGKPQAPFLSIQPEGISLGFAMTRSDPALIDIMLQAEKAKDLGVQLDNSVVVDYLTKLSGFTTTEMRDFESLAKDTLSHLPRDPNTRLPLVTTSQLMERLKLELTALQAESMLRCGLDGFSTAELWEYHGQLHRRFKIEAYPIDTLAYESQFKESKPPEEELKKIYQKGKDRISHPDLYEPGFHKPLKLAFGYVRVDSQDFLAAAKKQIPEEKVVEEYEKEIKAGNFRKLKLEPADDTKQPKKEENNNKEKPGESAPGGDGKSAPGTEKKNTPEAKSEVKSDSKPPSSDADSPTRQPSKPKEENGECQDPPASSEPEKSEPKKSEPAKGDAKSPAEDQSDTKPEEQEFRPLAEVREQLLNRLARPEAEAATEAAIKAVTRAVQEYGAKYTLWYESKKADPKTTVKDPGELRIKSLADKYHVTVHQTPLVDQFEFAATELGGQGVSSGPLGGMPFASEEYFTNRPLYAPQQTSSRLDGTIFVYWRTLEEPAAEVTYEQARPQVVKAWIRQQAEAAARKDAQALADKANKAGSLKEVLTEEQRKKVVEPLPFSWLTRSGSLMAFRGTPPRITEVPGIPLAGEDFMKGVFGLKVGEAGVAFNQPHSTVYVVRAVAEEPALDIRREMFLQSLQAGIFGDLVQYAARQRQRAVNEVVDELRSQYKLEWR